MGSQMFRTLQDIRVSATDPYFHINPLQPRVLFIFILLVACIDYVYEYTMAYYIHKAGNV